MEKHREREQKESVNDGEEVNDEEEEMCTDQVESEINRKVII